MVNIPKGTPLEKTSGCQLQIVSWLREEAPKERKQATKDQCLVDTEDWYTYEHTELWQSVQQASAQVQAR